MKQADLMDGEAKKLWITSAQEFALRFGKWRDKVIASFSPENQQAIHKFIHMQREGKWPEGVWFFEAGQREASRKWRDMPAMTFPDPMTPEGCASAISYVRGVMFVVEERMTELSAELSEAKPKSEGKK